jgi:hypothetical protein
MVRDFITFIALAVFALVAMVSVHGNVVYVSCTFTTGNCVGVGGGNSLFRAASCNGSSDDSAAFASFNRWAVNTWQASHSGKIELLWPNGGTCLINSSSTVSCPTNPSNLTCPFANIKNLFLEGNGGTLKIATQVVQSISGTGLYNDGAHSARTASANSGDTCVSLITAAQASLFSIGAPVLMTGFDLQSIWKVGVSFPPNPQFWDHLHVSSVDASKQCDGITSGASVRFTSPLTNQYLSTWPSYFNGNSMGVDAGGPATLYALSSSFDTTFEIDNMTIDDPDQLYAIGDTAIYNNVTFSNVGCATPTQNVLFKVTNSNFACGNGVEVDKVIDNIITSGSSFGGVFFQSTGAKLWQDTGSSLVSLQGSPKSFVGTGTTFSSVMKPGATGYGRSDSFSCTGCSVASLQQGGVVDGAFGIGVQHFYTMSSGTIKIANGTSYTAVQNNGGAAQLVVTSSAGWTTGQYVNVGVGGGPYNGVWQVTVDDPTHMTLVGSTFSVTTTGWVCPSSLCAIPWAAPGTNIMFGTSSKVEAIGQVTSVTQDANFIYINTTGLGSSFPADVTTIYAHPAPKFNCHSCTGADSQIASIAQAPTDAPLFSYQKFTYTGAVGAGPLNSFITWGALSWLDINVTNAYSGGLSPIFHLSQFDNWAVYVSGSATTYGPRVDAKTTGDRAISFSGTVTCNGSAGACSGSDVLTTPSGLWFGYGTTPAFSADTSGSCPGVNCPAVTFTVQTNQGVINP